MKTLGRNAAMKQLLAKFVEPPKAKLRKEDNMCFDPDFYRREEATETTETQDTPGVTEGTDVTETTNEPVAA